MQKPTSVNRHFTNSPTKREALGISSTPLSREKHSISLQLEECDEFESESITEDNRIDEKTSFVSNMTERKRIEKKKKIVNYLEEHRNNLPTERSRGLKEEVMFANEDEDEFEEQKGNLENELELIEHTEIKNRLFEKFILEFNKNPHEAIEMFIEKNVIKENTPQSIANYLLKVEGINKNVLGEYFGKNDERVLAILHAYCDLLGFHELEFDLALRKLLSKFLLPGEAQQIERIVWEFAQSYYAQNIETYENAEELFPLAYSIIMLATDAHNPKQEKKMTSEQFVKNTQRACPSFSDEYLERVYSRIVKQKLEIQKSVYEKLTDLYLTSAKEALGFAEELKRGTIVWKISLNEKKWYKWRHMDECEFYKRKLFLSEDESRICWQDPTNPTEEPRHILICTITDITLGIANHLSSKMNIPKECDNEYFTITTPLRTLDIRTENARIRARWLGYLRGVMILKRERRIEELERNCVIRREQLEEIWHSEVFPKWDLYWDYELKKPRQKGFFKEKVEKFCHCFTKRTATAEEPILLGLPSTNNLLQTLFRYGLPQSIRKPLWDELIGNTLQMSQPIIEHIKHSAIYSFKLRGMSSESEIVEMAEFLLTLRPDLPQVKDLLEMARVLHKVYINEKGRLMAMANLVFKYHFLPFYKGDRLEIELRTKLFDELLQLNAPFVKLHLDAIKLETRLYLVPWFLSIFSNVFKEQEMLLRIWDNFLLEGELYLFKVGIALVKYFEIELKMCTFYEGLKLLKFSNIEKSSLLFFDILEKEINVKPEHYYEYVLKRKHAMVKTKIQSIPLG